MAAKKAEKATEDKNSLPDVPKTKRTVPTKAEKRVQQDAKRAHAKGNPGQGGAQPGAGRPRLAIPYAQIEAVSRLHPSDEEIAGFCGISRMTLEEWKKDAEYQACVERGRANGKLNLRRRQLKKAEDGDGTMLVWLGKNLLGQADKNEVKVSGQLSVVIDLGDK